MIKQLIKHQVTRTEVASCSICEWRIDLEQLPTTEEMDILIHKNCRDSAIANTPLRPFEIAVLAEAHTYDTGHLTTIQSTSVDVCYKPC